MTRPAPRCRRVFRSRTTGDASSSREPTVTRLEELQERGTFRTQYTGTTLREHLDIPWPDQAATGTTREAVAS